jgi:hypothetical protein
MGRAWVAALLCLAAFVHAHKCVHDEFVAQQPAEVLAPQHYPNQDANHARRWGLSDRVHGAAATAVTIRCAARTAVSLHEH